MIESPDALLPSRGTRLDFWLWLAPVVLVVVFLSLAAGRDAWSPPRWAAEPALLLLLFGAALAATASREHSDHCDHRHDKNGDHDDGGFHGSVPTPVPG